MSDMDLSHDWLGYGWFGSGGLSRSRWFDSWYVAGAKPVSIVLDLSIGGIPISFCRF
jgi:hypothetical protein